VFGSLQTVKSGDKLEFEVSANNPKAGLAIFKLAATDIQEMKN
jgi:hypothetical protein